MQNYTKNLKTANKSILFNMGGRFFCYIQNGCIKRTVPLLDDPC